MKNRNILFEELIIEEENLSGIINDEKNDVITDSTWKSIIACGHDVSITTANKLGRVLENMSLLHYILVERICEREHDTVNECMLEVIENMDASLFNALHGHYKQSISTLRTSLEILVHCFYVKMSEDNNRQLLWKIGEYEISFGKTCTEIAVICETHDEFKHLKKYFDKGGIFRTLYRNLCMYVHATLDTSNGEIWQSNGPVYVRKAMINTYKYYRKIFFICFLLLDIFIDNRDAQDLGKIVVDDIDKELLKTICTCS